jgi:hypothetical protein
MSPQPPDPNQQNDPTREFGPDPLSRPASYPPVDYDKNWDPIRELNRLQREEAAAAGGDPISAIEDVSPITGNPNSGASGVDFNPISAPGNSVDTSDSRSDEGSNQDKTEADKFETGRLSEFMNSKTAERVGLDKASIVAKLNKRKKKKTKNILLGVLISGAMAGGVSVVGSIPMAMESILGDASTQYSNFSTEQIIKKAFNDYFKEDVLKPRCLERAGNAPHLRAKCNVGGHSTTGLLKRARDDMRANKYDEKLANAGIGWEVDPNSDKAMIMITKDGSPLPDLGGGIDFDNLDMFEMGGHQYSKFIDSKISEILKQESRWKYWLKRGPTMRAMRQRTGSTGCFFACTARDRGNEIKNIPKKAFAKFMQNNVISPNSQLLNNVFGCILGGGDSCTTRAMKTKAIEEFSKASARLFSDDVAKSLDNLFDGAVNGEFSTKLKEEGQKLVAKLFGDEISSLVGSVSNPATLAIKVIIIAYKVGKATDAIVTKIPKMIRVRNMLVMVAVAGLFGVMISEYKLAAVPLADIGAMLMSLAGMGGSRIFASMFMGSGNKTAQNGQPYSCNSAEEGGVAGSISSAFVPEKIAEGSLTCAAYMLDFLPDILKNAILKTISDAYQAINSIPGSSILMGALDWASSQFGNLVSSVFSIVPGVEKLQEFVGERISEFQTYLMAAIAPSIVNASFGIVQSLTEFGGARVFDAIVGGMSSIGQYIMPRDEQGAGPISSAALTSLDSAIAEQRAQDMQYASVYDRFFNMDSTTSNIGASLFANFAFTSFGTSSIANIINPMQNLSLAFNNTFEEQTFAAGTSMPGIMAKSFATPVRSYSVSNLKTITDGDLPDPDSAQCQEEITSWKQQIESNSDTSDDSKTDILGYGIPEGDGSGTSPCLLVDTSLKVLTTGNTDTNDFPMKGSGGSSSGPTTTAAGSTVGPGTSLPTCPAGSSQVKNNLGPVNGDEYLFEAYDNGVKGSIRLCSIDGFKVSAIDSDGAESTPGTKYYIPDSRGSVLIDSRYADKVVAMYADAKKSGVDLVAIGSYRTHEHQIDASGNGSNPGYAKPGFSRHETGRAIDFLDDNKNRTANCRDGNMEGSRCVSRGNAIWEWMDANALKYGYKQLLSESWHWSPDGQ